MTPVRAPDVVRGDVPGLLCRGMPLRWRDEDTRFVATGAVFFDADDGPWAIAAPCEGLPLGTQDHPSNFDVDWSGRAAIYLSLAWLADRGFSCLWMLPTTHGGRVEAWDGLTAWDVSAIVVSRSVGRVARGLGPIADVLSGWCGSGQMVGGECQVQIRCSERFPMRAVVAPDGWCLTRNGKTAWTEATYVARGPETGDAGKLAADRAAIAEGCALLCDGGVCCPEL